MSVGGFAYKSEDRSILLPYYKRFLVEPLLPFIPARINPNTLTHLGHLTNLSGVLLLLGLWQSRGWPFVVTAILLQIYIWFDNADGGHARRTGQCSPGGELLDHGLDILNVVYMGYLSAMTLGMSALGWVVVVGSIAGAGSVTYWEQGETGIFRLGSMNQIESGIVLSLALLVSAVFGVDVWGKVELFGVTPRTAILAWTIGTIIVGATRALIRVQKARGIGAAAPLAGLFAACIAAAFAVSTGALTAVAAVTIVAATNVFFAMRMLLVRWRRSLEPDVGTGSLATLLGTTGAVVVAVTLLHHFEIGPGVGPVSFTVAVTAAGVLGFKSIADARHAIRLVSAR
ncbi:MAG: CDP-alcohol phosphatidyltransferase family protein [Polyangiaceae bacterium]